MDHRSSTQRERPAALPYAGPRILPPTRRIAPARLIKILFLGALILLAAGLLMFGPRPTPPIPEWAMRPDGSPPVVVDYWEKWTGDEARQMQQIVTEFNQSVGKTEGIFVRFLSMTKVDEKAIVATAAGVPPDVVGMWDTNIAQWSALGALTPLNDRASARGIRRDQYKTVYWDACTREGKLYGLISTPGCVALHYNRRLFQENADKLRAAGCDPDRPPRTIAELDRYAKALDDLAPDGRIRRAGYLPLEPGWYTVHTPIWWGGDLYDARAGKLELTSPACAAAFDWIASYSRRLGVERVSTFRSAFADQVDSPQNAFMDHKVAMVQQGPWMANYIANQKPELNHWNATPDDLKRERAGTLRLADRRRLAEWAAAPFPSAVEGLDDVTYVPFDVLAIPAGARHKNEAFEFLAYVQRQDVMEKLCSLHCKNSPLASVSKDFIENHPNPYIDVFERLSASKNARPVPPVPIWPEINDVVGKDVAQKVALLQAAPAQALARAQARLENRLEEYRKDQEARRQWTGSSASAGSR
jgi:multiple sugar transport system substrate-binding protein